MPIDLPEQKEFEFILSNWMTKFYLQLTKKAIIVYPNSGEVWDGRAKRWLVSRGCFEPLTKKYHIYWAKVAPLSHRGVTYAWFIGYVPLSLTHMHSRMHLKLLLLIYLSLWFGWQPSKCFGDDKFEVFATRWHNSGARLIGGCCRTTPSTILAISKVLKESS